MKAQLFALAFSAFISAPAIAHTNCIADYLNGADRQFETEEQRREIKRALTDMLVLKSNLLLRKRYRDYQMHPKKWNAINILERYFVPTRPVAMSTDCFVASVETQSARAAVKSQLELLEKSKDAH